jgi:hypothetical protein
MEITPGRIWTRYVHITGKNNIVADALSRLEKDEDEFLSDT